MLRTTCAVGEGHWTGLKSISPEDVHLRGSKAISKPDTLEPHHVSFRQHSAEFTDSLCARGCLRSGFCLRFGFGVHANGRKKYSFISAVALAI